MKTTNNTSDNFTFVDLFSGIGGFHISLSSQGGNCLAFSEIDSDAIDSYCKNFKHATKEMNLGDIKKINQLPKHDLLTAGVPCQSWSIAGRNLGFDDDRGQLWNDTIYLLKQSKPRAFIFENVKGLIDPRNKDSFTYILDRIKLAGYYAKFFVLNSHEYGVPQNRIRVYIVGFRFKKHYLRFNVPEPSPKRVILSSIFNFKLAQQSSRLRENIDNPRKARTRTSLTKNNRYNKYFLFNDIRNGETTIHSWDIIQTTKRQKEICYLLLKNRRKKHYGKLDGNPLSLNHFKSLDSTIRKKEINELIKLGIIKSEKYKYLVDGYKANRLLEEEIEVLKLAQDNALIIDDLKTSRQLKINKISITKTLNNMEAKKIAKCTEVRYDFKNTKISSGLFGVNRIFLPGSDVFSTLVASDTQDHISMIDIEATTANKYKQDFIKKIYKKNNYRKITRKEACQMQGFSPNFTLPDDRKKWMKLLGNSVSIPVIDAICKEIIDTGVFNSRKPIL